MARSGRPWFTWDHLTGALREFPPGESASSALASAPEGTRHFRVLVADDDETDRFLTICQLGQAWWVEQDLMVECAADGAEALEMIRQNQYKLVLLDWDMPYHNGGEVLRTMRADGHHYPVVVVTGQPRERIEPELQAAAAVFAHKDELDPVTFRSAIAASLQLQADRGKSG